MIESIGPSPSLFFRSLEPGTAFGPLQATAPIRVLYFLLGAGLLVAAIVDILWTTLWVDGGSGPLSSRITTWI